jgi:hypothetical protein
MPRNNSQPFDIQANDAADVTEEFWGATRGWEGEPDDGPADGADFQTRSMYAIRTGLAGLRPRRVETGRQDVTGRVDRTRSHGMPRPSAEELPSGSITARAAREATLGELAAGWIDDDEWPELDELEATSRISRTERVQPQPVDESELVPLTATAPRRKRSSFGSIDPLLARLGAIIVVGVLLVPFARSASGDGSDGSGSGAALAMGVEDLPSGSASRVTVAATEPAQVAATLAVAPMAQAAEATDPADDTVEGAAQAVTNTTLPSVAAATVDEPADRVELECSLTYTAGPGDSWYRIADAAGISPDTLLDTNLAGLETPIFPDDPICLPAGATMPSQPVATTAAPVTTVKATTTTTTVKPVTTNAPPAPASTAQVQQLIRDIWPDELEEKALQIAWRESNYKASAYNGSCCWGVFQIHWTSHKSWLDDYGIYSTNDLLDARKNITAAYALYQRAGGWGPWGG